MISVIIPVYNEEKSIEKTIKEIKRVLIKNKIDKSTEIIIVNDGSTDNTRNIALSLGIRVIDNDINMGYGYSLKKGITNSSNDVIVIIDGDLTYPFDYISKMLSKKNKGYDLIVGARSGQYYKGNPIKYGCRLIIKKIAEFISGEKIKDINSGFRIFDKLTIMNYFPKICDTFSFTTTQTLNYLLDNRKVGYVDIPYNKRIGKSKIKLFKDGFIMLKQIIICGLYYKPLKTCLSIFTIIFIICLLFTLIIIK